MEKKFAVPSLATHKILAQSDVNQITTREEQEQYKIHGMQDGKVDELISYEKKQRKLLQKNPAREHEDDPPEKEEELLEQGPSDDNDSLKDKIEQQDKKKKRKKRKKKGNAEKHEQE